mgnify:CR=1 FL=1
MVHTNTVFKTSMCSSRVNVAGHTKLKTVLLLCQTWKSVPFQKLTKITAYSRLVSH